MKPTVPARLSLLALVALAATHACHAQVKTDGEWRGAAGAAVAATSGNSESSTLALSADMLRATTADKLAFGANASYARSKNAAGVTSTTANKWSAFGQYDRNLTAQLYAFGKLGLEGDELISLALRTAVAGGLGYKLVDTKESAFSLFGGVGYTVDQYDTPQTIGSKTAKRFSRASVYLGEESSHTLSASTTFKQRLELYPGVSGDKALLAKFTAGLSTAVSNTLSFNVNLVADHNSKPPAGRRDTDWGVLAGLSVKFGAP